MKTRSPCQDCTQGKSCFLCGDLNERGGAISACKELLLCNDGAPLANRHLLLAPREHFSSFRSYLGTALRLFNIRQTLERVAARSEGRHVFFEHGTAEGARDKGCVDHAHIHIVGVADRRYNRIALLDEIGCRFDIDSIHEAEGFDAADRLLPEGVEYFWLRDGCGPDLFVTGQGRGERQVARRALCAGLDKAFAPFLNVGAAVGDLTRGEVARRMNLDQTGIGDIFLLEGASASGKTTISRLLAESMGGRHVPSGLFFCAAAQHLRGTGLLEPGTSPEKVLCHLQTSELTPLSELEATEEIRLLAARVFQDGRYWTALKSRIAAHVARLASAGIHCVVDGRGLQGQWGAHAKEHFLHSSSLERKRRFRMRARSGELSGLPGQTERDRLDTTRQEGRLVPGEKSRLLDTSGKAPEQIIAEILNTDVKCETTVSDLYTLAEESLTHKGAHASALPA